MKEIPTLKAWHRDKLCVVTDFCPYCSLPHMHWPDGSLPGGYNGLHVADCHEELRYEITVLPGRPPWEIRRTLRRLDRLFVKQREQEEKRKKVEAAARRQARWEASLREEREEIARRGHEEDSSRKP